MKLRFAILQIRIPTAGEHMFCLPILAVVGALSLVTSCAPAGRAAPVASTREQVPLQGEAAAIAMAKRDSARYPYTAADIWFMSSMIAHHSQAITMAALAPTRSANASIRILSERIGSGQQDEIATMQRWLSDRGQRVAQGMSGHEMNDHDMSGHHESTHDSVTHRAHKLAMPAVPAVPAVPAMAAMPGMINKAQLKQLEGSKGAEFDRLFLTYMIRHHRGAVSMVQDLISAPGAAQDETVFKFASDVNVDQVTEIARMEKMLAALSP